MVFVCWVVCRRVVFVCCVVCRRVVFVCLVVCRRVLRPSHQSRYLHSAVLLGRLMLVFGGNTHNDTSAGRVTKCYSNSFMVYDLGTSATGPVRNRTLLCFGTCHSIKKTVVRIKNLYLLKEYTTEVSERISK